jgi:hypothetical protein
LTLAFEQAGARPPRTLGKRIDAALSGRWIDKELADDLHVLRQLRNEFAHSVTTDSLHDNRIEQTIDALKIPQRAYDDWGKLRAVATASGGVMLYTHQSPPETGETLRLGSFTFKMALQAILGVLVSSLKLKVDDGTREFSKLTNELPMPE